MNTETLRGCDECSEECGDRICESCYEESVFPCCWCGEDEDVDNRLMLVVFDSELSVIGGELETGIYKIDGHYFSDGMIEYRIFKSGLSFVQELPEGLESEGYKIGHLCKQCQSKTRQPSDQNAQLKENSQ